MQLLKGDEPEAEADGDETTEGGAKITAAEDSDDEDMRIEEI